MQHMTFSQKLGLVSCILILASLFFNWAWYPDIEKYFTAFFSENNYYGKPGKLLMFFAITGIVFYLINKVWTQRLNLIFSALCMAYAIKTYLLYTSGYDGYVPDAQAGIYLMLLGCLGQLIAAMGWVAVVKKQLPANPTDTAMGEKA